MLSAAGDGVCCLLQEMVCAVCMLKIVHWSCGVLLEIQNVHWSCGVLLEIKNVHWSCEVLLKVCWCAAESLESPLECCSMFT